MVYAKRKGHKDKYTREQGDAHYMDTVTELTQHVLELEIELKSSQEQHRQDVLAYENKLQQYEHRLIYYRYTINVLGALAALMAVLLLLSEKVGGV